MKRKPPDFSFPYQKGFQPDQSRRMFDQWADPDWRQNQIYSRRRGQAPAAEKAAAIQKALMTLKKDKKRVYKMLQARYGGSRQSILRRMSKWPPY